MMTPEQLAAIAAIEAQQPKDRSDVWVVGQQLKDICRAEPAASSLIAKDLESKSMSLQAAAKAMKAFADKHREKGTDFVCVTPEESDKVLRDFYGLPAADAVPGGAEAANVPGGRIIDLADFF